MNNVAKCTQTPKSTYYIFNHSHKLNYYTSNKVLNKKIQTPGHCVWWMFLVKQLIIYFIELLLTISTTLVSMRMETIFNLMPTICTSSTTQMTKRAWTLLMKRSIWTQINCIHTVQVYHQLINSFNFFYL